MTSVIESDLGNPARASRSFRIKTVCSVDSVWSRDKRALGFPGEGEGQRVNGQFYFQNRFRTCKNRARDSSPVSV